MPMRVLWMRIWLMRFQRKMMQINLRFDRINGIAIDLTTVAVTENCSLFFVGRPPEHLPHSLLYFRRNVDQISRQKNKISWSTIWNKNMASSKQEMMHPIFVSPPQQSCATTLNRLCISSYLTMTNLFIEHNYYTSEHLVREHATAVDKPSFYCAQVLVFLPCCTDKTSYSQFHRAF